jgi:hypothetical protein
MSKYKPIFLVQSKLEVAMAPLFLFLFSILIAACNGIGVVEDSAMYSTHSIDAGSDSSFAAVVFRVTFDEDLYLNDTLISDLSLIGGGSQGDLPQAMMAQFGTVFMTCECDGCNAFSECNATHCVYGSYTEEQENGPPRQLIPLPSVTEPLFAIFSAFAGINTDQSDPAPRNYAVVKITRNFHQQTKTWVPYVHDNFDPSLCTIGFYNRNNSPTSASLRTENGTDIAPLTISGFTEREKTCNFTALEIELEEFFEAISSIQNKTSKDAMQQMTWKLVAYMSRDAWSGCFSMVEDFLVMGETNLTVTNDVGCRYDRSDERWEDDPCCNQQMALETCCVPKNVTVLKETVTGINQTGIEGRCDQPEKALLLLNKYYQNTLVAVKCESQAKTRGFDFELWSYMTDFITTCNEEIYGTNDAPTCKSNDDCYTSCDTQSSRCIVPYDDPSPYMVECFIDNMNTEMQRYLRRKWGLTASSTEEEVEEAFRDHFLDPGCVGPTGQFYNGMMTLVEVDECGNIDRCFCHSQEGGGGEQQCFEEVYIPGNETACISDEGCNWNMLAEDEGQCENVSDTSTFCGDCRSNSCWEVTTASSCTGWVPNESECIAVGGSYSSQYQFCSFPNLTTIANCLPPTICPDPENQYSNSTPRWMRQDYWCNGFCYIQEASVNASTCTAAQNETANVFTVFDTNVASGDGVCKVYTLWGNEPCTSKGYTWYPGKVYRSGSFDTEDKCEAGMCTINPSMNSTECASMSSCNVPCPKCRPEFYGSTLCYSPSQNQSDCENMGGNYDAGNEICRFSAYLSSQDCTSNNHTFETCEDLNKTECIDCSLDPESCRIHSGVLQCWLNRWDSCSDQEECEGSGFCNDWELENMQNEYCRNWDNMISSNCTGSCIVAYNTSGDFPSCNGNSVRWTRLGCQLYDVLSVEECESSVNNGTWVLRANTQQECLDHGYGCKEKRFWNRTPKNESMCNTCGGDYEALFSWRSGNWVTGSMRNLQWVERTWGPLNQWNLTLNWTKIQNTVDEVVALMMAKQMKSQFMCKYGMIAQNIKTIACLCGDEKGTDCLNRTSDSFFVNIGEADMFSGLDANYEWGTVRVTSFNNTVSGDTDMLSITILAEPDMAGYTPDNTTDSEGGSSKSNKRMKRGKSVIISLAEEDAESYTIVYNAVIELVGQLAGPSVVFEAGELEGEVELCMEIDSTIAIDTETYPQPDIGMLDGENIVTLGQEAEIDGDLLCGMVSESGTYYPVYRTSNNQPVPSEAVDAGGCNFTCSNNGTFDGDEEVCICADGFVGTYCTETDCGTNGIYDEAADECVCIEGYKGDLCDECNLETTGPDGETLMYVCYYVGKDTKTYVLLAVNTTEFYLFLGVNSILPGTQSFDCACRSEDELESFGSYNTSLQACIEILEGQSSIASFYGSIIAHLQSSSESNRSTITHIAVTLFFVTVAVVMTVTVTYKRCARRIFLKPHNK